MKEIPCEIEIQLFLLTVRQTGTNTYRFGTRDEITRYAIKLFYSTLILIINLIIIACQIDKRKERKITVNPHLVLQWYGIFFLMLFS
jgi:hypothetical protein